MDAKERNEAIAFAEFKSKEAFRQAELMEQRGYTDQVKEQFAIALYWWERMDELKEPIDKPGLIVYNLIRKREKERDKKMYDKMVAQAKTMTTDQLKDARFINNMIDRWTAEDRMWDSVLFAELMARKNAK